MECSQDEMVFLDKNIIATLIVDKKVVITTDMYSKKTNTHQYLSPNSCHPKFRTKNISLGVADRIRRNCSNNITVSYPEFFWVYRYMYQDQDFIESIGKHTVRQTDQQKLWLCLAAFRCQQLNILRQEL